MNNQENNSLKIISPNEVFGQKSHQLTENMIQDFNEELSDIRSYNYPYGTFEFYFRHDLNDAQVHNLKKLALISGWESCGIYKCEANPNWRTVILKYK